MTPEQRVATLALLPYINKIEAANLSIRYREVYKIRIDWHEFAYFLDELNSRGILEISKPGGRVEYRLARPLEANDFRMVNS